MTSLALRALVPADAEIFAAWATDDIFATHAGWRHATTPEEFVPWWRNLIAQPDTALIRLAVVCNHEIVGYVDLHGEGSDSRELGFVIGPSSRWGRGLGTRAARAGLAYGFENLALESIWAEAVEANTGSVRILRRLGMTYTGEGAEETFVGRPSRYAQYCVTRAAWLEETQRGESAPSPIQEGRPVVATRRRLIEWGRHSRH